MVPAPTWARRRRHIESWRSDRFDGSLVISGCQWPDQDRIDVRPRRQRTGPWRDHDQRVSANEGGQSRRRLWSGGRSLQMSRGVDANDPPLKLDAVGRPNGVIEPHSSPRTIDLRRPEHAPQGGSDEDLETDEGGYRIARKTEYQGVPRGSEVERLPRLHKYAAKVDLGELREQRLDEVEIAHGHAATGDDDVTLADAVDEGGPERG